MASLLSVKSAAYRLVDALVRRGVTTFFGIPGGPVCPIFEAIRLHPGAKLVESRHETHGAFAAALYYRRTRKVPALVVTAGPGATNAVTGVASASVERIPMLVIAGDTDWATGKVVAQDSGPHGIDLESIFASITRHQGRSASARSVVSQAMKALQHATHPYNPGPSLFVVPLDHSMAECEPVEINEPVLSLPLGVPHMEVLRRISTLLAEAERPLIVLGTGCRGHEDTIEEFIDVTNIPFVTTPGAKGVVSERRPNSLRNGGMAASLWARKYTSEPVDVCLVLGSDLDDTSVGPTPYIGRGGRLLHVDVNPSVFGRNFPTELGLVADLDAVVRGLTRDGVWNERAPALLREAKAGSPWDESTPETDERTPVAPHRVMMDLQAALPGARFVTDIGEHMLFALHYLTAEPGTFFMQLNLGSMGSGIAGAVGLALADRSKPVVCVAGDGCAQMSGMEILVALKERLPLLLVVINDGRYNMVHHGMRQIFGEAEQYDMPPVNFAMWAAALGIPSEVIQRPGEITTSLVREILREGPAVLDVRIDPSVRIKGGGRVEALQLMSMAARVGITAV